MQQIGTVLGTLIGIRGYSRGESFVARNVGLRSVWEGGEWRVKIILMDHDALVILGSHNTDFYPHEALHGLLLDETYLWGRGEILGTVGHLQRIYRISENIYQQGLDSARAAAKTAYKKTQRQLASDPNSRALFHETFVERLSHWDELVAAFLRATANGDDSGDWKEKLYRTFAKKYDQQWLDTHIDALEKNRGFLERHSYLFSNKKPAKQA